MPFEPEATGTHPLVRSTGEALVILTICIDQHPFMPLLMVQLAEVAPACDPSFNLLSLFIYPSLLPFMALSASACYSSNTEGLYQLGGPRCPPQSSIEGLEDVEVGSQLIACQYI